MIKARSALVWYVIALMATLTAVSFLLTGLRVDAASNPAYVALIAVLMTLNAVYRFVRPDLRLRTATETAAQMLLILLFGILLTYAATATGLPYRDATLLAADRTLGFDREAYLAFFKARPWLSNLTGTAYLALLPQFLLAPLALLVAHQAVRAQTWLLAVGIALIATSGISVFAPAVSAFVYVDLGGPAHIPAGFYTSVPTIEALRAGTLHTIPLNDLEALITFPSFHTTGALLFIWALWPLQRLRWVAVPLNAALILATPVDGGHYAIDVAAGAMVMLVSVAAATWLCAQAERRETTAQPALYPSK